MSFASTFSVADPPLAGDALPGVRLLGLVRRMLQTGRAMARCVNWIARQKLAGQDLSRLAPAGFDATLTNALVVQAVAFTAALRERLLALAGRPVFPLAPEPPKPERAPRGRGPADYTRITGEVSADDRHDWAALAKAWRMGPGGVAFAARRIVGKSDRQVVVVICDFLRRAAVQLGAEADLARIAALEEAARALCPDEAAAEGGVVDAGGAGDASAARAARQPSDAPDSEPETGAQDDPPPEPPD